MYGCCLISALARNWKLAGFKLSTYTEQIVHVNYSLKSLFIRKLQCETTNAIAKKDTCLEEFKLLTSAVVRQAGS